MLNCLLPRCFMKFFWFFKPFLRKRTLLFFFLFGVKWVDLLRFLSECAFYIGRLMSFSLLITFTSWVSIFSIYFLTSSSSLLSSFSETTLPKPSFSIFLLSFSGVNKLSFLIFSNYLASLFLSLSFAVQSISMNFFLPRLFFNISTIVSSPLLIALYVSTESLCLFSLACSSSLI